MHSSRLPPHPLVADASLLVPRLFGGPRLTGDIKCQPEDFVVEEEPAYLPSGEGDHLFLWVEKRGVPAFMLIERLAHALAIRTDEVGTAGMKDARAVTRQWVSVPLRARDVLEAGGIEQLAAQDIRVLSHKAHGNKLRTGHAKGNRFDICVRNVQASGAELDACIAGWLADTEKYGVVNAFGQQRFGHSGATVALGLGVLGAPDVPRAPRLSKGKLRLALSAVQSALFNAFLRERMAGGGLYAAQEGDVAMVCASGGPFVVDDADEVNERIHAREVVLTGPLFGPKMRAATHGPGEQEAHLLTRYHIEPSLFLPFAKLAQGARRACVVWPREVSAVREGERDVRARFFLSSGTYATELLGQWLALSAQTPAS